MWYALFDFKEFSISTNYRHVTLDIRNNVGSTLCLVENVINVRTYSVDDILA